MYRREDELLCFILTSLVYRNAVLVAETERSPEEFLVFPPTDEHAYGRSVPGPMVRDAWQRGWLTESLLPLGEKSIRVFTLTEEGRTFFVRQVQTQHLRRTKEEGQAVADFLMQQWQRDLRKHRLLSVYRLLGLPFEAWEVEYLHWMRAKGMFPGDYTGATCIVFSRQPGTFEVASTGAEIYCDRENNAFAVREEEPPQTR